MISEQSMKFNKKTTTHPTNAVMHYRKIFSIINVPVTSIHKIILTFKRKKKSFTHSHTKNIFNVKQMKKAVKHEINKYINSWVVLFPLKLFLPNCIK